MKKIIFFFFVLTSYCFMSSCSNSPKEPKDCNQSECNCGVSCECSENCKCH